MSSRYTMERERDIHREVLQALGLVSTVAARRVETADDGTFAPGPRPRS